MGSRRSLSLVVLALLCAAAPASADTVNGGAAAPGASTPVPEPAPATTAPATQSPVSSPARLGDRLPLRRGMKGGDVRELQRLLARLGQSLAADGDFGRATARALSGWERAAKRRADGRLAAGDLTALRAAAQSAPPPSVPPPAAPATATIAANGLAVAPQGAPAGVVSMIAAANRIAKTPYRYGGGHPKFDDTAYDCSGSVSYALHGAGLLNSPWDSTMLESLGQPGPGIWVTVYANAGHTFMVIAGLRFDTSGQRQAGTRWQAVGTRGYDGFVVRHPTGY